MADAQDGDSGDKADSSKRTFVFLTRQRSQATGDSGGPGWGLGGGGGGGGGEGGWFVAGRIGHRAGLAECRILGERGGGLMGMHRARKERQKQEQE